MRNQRNKSKKQENKSVMYSNSTALQNTTINDIHDEIDKVIELNNLSESGNESFVDGLKCAKGIINRKFGT